MQDVCVKSHAVSVHILRVCEIVVRVCENDGRLVQCNKQSPEISVITIWYTVYIHYIHIYIHKQYLYSAKNE